MFDESIGTVASPFFGGGSVELELADRGKVVYAAELFKPVAYLWQQVKENPSQLVSKVSLSWEKIALLFTICKKNSGTNFPKENRTHLSVLGCVL